MDAYAWQQGISISDVERGDCKRVLFNSNSRKDSVRQRNGSGSRFGEKKRDGETTVLEKSISCKREPRLERENAFMQAVRYALRSEQIPDRVLCQRSALVIGADEFRSFHRVNVFHATRMIPRSERNRTRSLSPLRLGHELTYFPMRHASEINMEIAIKDEDRMGGVHQIV